MFPHSVAFLDGGKFRDWLMSSGRTPKVFPLDAQHPENGAYARHGPLCPMEQRQASDGIGSKLIREAIHLAQANGMKAVRLDALASNITASHRRSSPPV